MRWFGKVSGEVVEYWDDPHDWQDYLDKYYNDGEEN